MILCKDCEFYQPGTEETAHFLCDPFTNIKEPECLIKWQFKQMEREIDEVDEADSWKYLDDADEDDDEEDGFHYRP